MMSRRRTADKKKKASKAKAVVAKSVDQKVAEAAKIDSDEVPNLSQKPNQIYNKKK